MTDALRRDIDAAAESRSLPISFRRVSIVNGATTSVIFVTAHYDVHCTVFTRGGRLLDAFNDSNTRFLELEDVRYFAHGSREPAIELPKTLLVKENIHLAILVSEDRRNESKVFFATLERRTMNAVVALPTVVVKGQVHAKAAVDPQGFLTYEAASFFPVTSATLIGNLALDRLSGTESPGAVIMVNKNAIFSLSLERP